MGKEEEKRRTLRVADSLWRRFKAACVMRGMEMNQRINELIAEDVEQYEKEKSDE